MQQPTPKKLEKFAPPQARSLFRSLFMDGWKEKYSTWQEAISQGSLKWAFTADKFEESANELGELLTYPEPFVNKWLTDVCSGLPDGSPDPTLNAKEFVTEVQTFVRQVAGEWVANGKPRKT